MSCVLTVFVQPRASRNAIIGWHKNQLKIALTAPPVEGAANAALIDFLADEWHIKRRQISVKSGLSSRHKILEIDLATETLQRLLPKP